jgi:hypothetical protein
MANIGRREDVDVFALLDAFTHPAGRAELRCYCHAMCVAECCSDLRHRLAPVVGAPYSTSSSARAGNVMANAAKQVVMTLRSI